MKRLGVVLLLFLIFAACNPTETTTETTSTETATTTVDTAATATETAAPSNVPPGDLEFATTASMANLYEIMAGQLAASKASGAAYKTFAATMVAQHTEIGDSYKPIAEKQHLPMPAQLTGQFLTLYQTLENTPAGAGFDVVYRQQMIQTHTDAVQLFTKEKDTGEDPELKAFAAKWLPTVEHHLEMANALPAS